MTIGVASGARIWAAYGAGPGQRYVAAQVIEEYLAVDDVFVRAIITHVAVGRGSAQGKPRSGGRAGSTGSSSRSRPCRSS